MKLNNVKQLLMDSSAFRAIIFYIMLGFGVMLSKGLDGTPQSILRVFTQVMLYGFFFQMMLWGLDALLGWLKANSNE